MTRQYDIAVLGTGNAGMAAARIARKAGSTVAIAESLEEIGGTCPLRGCVPKKVLVAAAEAMDTIEHAGDHAIQVDGASMNWAGLIERERAMIAGTSQAFVDSLNKRGIDLFRGTARFRDRGRLEIDGQEIEAGKVVIATGSKPRPLPFPGSEHLSDNVDILRDTQLPESVIFIGGGTIALEFAHVYARAGSNVAVLEVSPRILPGADPDVVARLHEATEKTGITILTEVEVKEVKVANGGFAVEFRRDGENRTLTAARVAHGAGRIPAVEELNLDAAGIEHEESKIFVTEYLASSSNPDVYVAGDALANSAQLSPLASHEGEVVGHNLVEGDVAKPDYGAVPSVVYTIPPLASVGLTVEAAEAEGLEVAAREYDMSGWLSAKLYGDEAAFAKVLTEKGSGRILGAHLLGKGTEEIIHLFAFAMKFGVTATEMADFVYAFPTSASEVKSLV